MTISRSGRFIFAGIALWVAIGALAYYAFSSGGLANRGDYQLKATFDQVDGLAVGAPVQLAGIKIGEVTRMTLDPKTYRPTVTFGIRGSVRLPEDSGALVMSDGLLGGKFVRIEPGSESSFMKPGDRFQFVQDSVIVELLLERIVQGAEARRRAALKERSADKGDTAQDGKPDDKKEP